MGCEQNPKFKFLCRHTAPIGASTLALGSTTTRLSELGSSSSSVRSLLHPDGLVFNFEDLLA